MGRIFSVLQFEFVVATGTDCGDVVRTGLETNVTGKALTPAPSVFTGKGN